MSEWTVKYVVACRQVGVQNYSTPNRFELGSLVIDHYQITYAVTHG